MWTCGMDMATQQDRPASTSAGNSSGWLGSRPLWPAMRLAGLAVSWKCGRLRSNCAPGTMTTMQITPIAM